MFRTIRPFAVLLGLAGLVASCTERETPIEVGGPDLQVLLSASDSMPTDGDTVRVSVEVANIDNVRAVSVTSVVVQADAGSSLSVVSANAGQGSFDQLTGRWNVGSLGVGVAASLELDVEVAAGSGGQALTATAYIASLDQSQTSTANDTASVQLSIGQRNVDVAVLKSVSDPQPLADSTVVFTVSLVNNGPGTVTDLVVFDTLAAAFLNPVHTVSAGALSGDSLWTVPSLAEGDTTTWATSATVDPSAAGGSATNTAVLRLIAQNDTTPTNNLATVDVALLISAPPAVQITQPADSTLFDPGATITFDATAVDPEEGDVSSSIEWTSDLAGVIGSGASFQSQALLPGIHTIVAAASDSDGGSGADTISLVIDIVSTPSALNVPFGGDASLPITLAEPAPVGGLDLTLVASDTTLVGTPAGSILVPEGATAGNATLSGLQPGTTDVVVSNAAFGSSTTSVSVTAELDILESNLGVSETFPQPVTIQLESQGTAIPAPAGGLEFTLTSVDPTCVAAPASDTIPGGFVQQNVTLSYGGGAALPCSTYVRASAPMLTSDSVNVTVNPTPGFTMSALTVGAGLQYGSFAATLGTRDHGGVTVRLESADSTTLLVSPNATTPGTAFIDVDVPDGSNRAFYYVQGADGATGTAYLVATAAGFASDSALVTVVQPGLDISGLSTVTTALSPLDPFTVRVGVPTGAQTGLAINQAIRAGGDSLVATLTSSTPAVGETVTLPDSVAPVTVTLHPGDFASQGTVASGGVAFDPISAGSTDIAASIPGFIQTGNAQRTVSVIVPTISVGSTVVGAGLQYGLFWATLAASEHGGTTVTLTSDDPSVMLVSPDASTPGTGSIDVFVPDGQSRANYYVQGVENQTGAVTLTVSANGFSTNTATITVVAPAFDIAALSPATTTLSPDDPFYVRLGVPNGGGTFLSIAQAIRAGGVSRTATITSSNATIGDLITLPDSASPVTVQINPADFNSPTTVAGGGVAFEPVTAGQVTVTASIPGLTGTNNASRSVDVSAPDISLSAATVGAGLQHGPYRATLGASDHPGVTVRIESQDSTVLLVSPDASTAGTPFFEAVVPAGQTRLDYWVHGVEGSTGVIAIDVTAAGFNAGTADVTAVQPAYDIDGLQPNQTSLSANDPFAVRVGVPFANLSVVWVPQPVRVGGSAVTATITSDNTSAGVLIASGGSSGSVTAEIPPGSFSTPGSVALGGLEFDPTGNGTTDVAVSIPGYLATTAATQSVSVTAPTISVPSATVGAGLMHGALSASLGASAHGGTTVTVTSSNPSALLLSANDSTTGSASIQVAVPDGEDQVSYWVHGVEGAAGVVSVSVTAPGFLNGSATVDVVTPGLDLVSLSTHYSASEANDDFYVRLGVPSSNQTDIAIQQPIRIGGPSLTATITSSDPGVAQLATQSSTGGQLLLQIAPGEATTGVSFAAGGAAIDPVAAGSTVVSAAIPGVITTGDGVRSVVIEP